MLARLRLTWAAARDSLWFIPSLLTFSAAVLAIVLISLEAEYSEWLAGDGYSLIGVSVDGARAVLSVIAGSIITVTGVVFSVTIVALQLASSQFTPRILRNFMADRVNQVVLGVFIATFTYTLLVLRVVRSVDEGNPFVPQISVSLAIVFSLLSIGYLIRFIDHAARFDSGVRDLEQGGGRRRQPGATAVSGRDRPFGRGAADRRIAGDRVAIRFRREGRLPAGGVGQFVVRTGARAPPDHSDDAAHRRIHASGTNAGGGLVREATGRRDSERDPGSLYSRSRTHARTGCGVLPAGDQRHGDPGAFARHQRSDDGHALHRPSFADLAGAGQTASAGTEAQRIGQGAFHRHAEQLRRGGPPGVRRDYPLRPRESHHHGEGPGIDVAFGGTVA